MTTQTTSKIEGFIESLSLPKDYCVLFETVEDCQLFFESYYMRNRYLVDDLLDFREYKINKSEKTLDLFIEECYTIGMKQAFESTFYQSFTTGCMRIVERAIGEGKTSIEQLFIGFQKNPNENILKNIR